MARLLLAATNPWRLEAAATRWACVGSGQVVARDCCLLGGFDAVANEALVALPLFCRPRRLAQAACAPAAVKFASASARYSMKVWSGRTRSSHDSLYARLPTSVRILICMQTDAVADRVGGCLRLEDGGILPKASSLPPTPASAAPAVGTPASTVSAPAVHEDHAGAWMKMRRHAQEAVPNAL